MNNFKVQVLIIVLLVAFPLVMIYFNGSKAIKGILGKPSSQQINSNATQSEIEPALSNNMKFGVYDPGRKLIASDDLDLEVYYISWLYFSDDALLDTLRNISKRGRTPVLTIEPWAKTEGDLLMQITDGNYNEEIRRIAAVLQEFNDTTYISWGHEMDQDLTERYSWSGKDPTQFIKAYKYVHEFLSRGNEGHLKWIWAPVAKPDCLKYYPGNEYVDAIGLPVYAFPEWELSFYGYIKSFKEVFGEKYETISSVNKPVFITEFGVTGSEDFKSFWVRNAFMNFYHFPQLQALIFFQSEDTPGVWGEDISTPNWQLSAETVEGLIKWAQEK